MSDIEVQEHEEKEARRVESIEKAMVADGVPTTQRVQQSYFGFEETHRCMLPDGVSYIEHRTLNEGSRKQYLNSVNREVAIKRASGDAVMKMAAGEEKHSLLKQAMCGWNLIDIDGSPKPFQKREVNEFLESANPKIIDLIEKDVRKYNTWLMADMSVEDLRKQIEELEEMIEAKEKEDEGKDS